MLFCDKRVRPSENTKSHYNQRGSIILVYLRISIMDLNENLNL